MSFEGQFEIYFPYYYDLNLGPYNTLGDQVQLVHLRCSKMDLIQILVIFSHKKLNPIISFICLFKQNKNPNKTAYNSYRDYSVRVKSWWAPLKMILLFDLTSRTDYGVHFLMVKDDGNLNEIHFWGMDVS